MNNKNLISIYPNTRGFGYVVLNNKGELLDYAMVFISPVDNEKCLKRIDKIISYYQPKTLILENSTNHQKSRIRKLLKKISKYNIKTFKYSEEEVKNVFEIFKAKNKYERSKKISEVYPELKTKLPEKRNPWEPENYYQAVFDALALMLTYYYFEE